MHRAVQNETWLFPDDRVDDEFLVPIHWTHSFRPERVRRTSLPPSPHQLISCHTEQKKEKDQTISLQKNLIQRNIRPNKPSSLQPRTLINSRDAEDCEDFRERRDLIFLYNNISSNVHVRCALCLSCHCFD